MTDKQVIIDCKYKFQNNEKFEGKPYCTLHNELCEDLSFACDDNCQIYDDYKQLARKTQECESLKQEIEILQNNFDTVTRDCNDETEILKQECEEYKKRAVYFKDVNKQLGYKYLTIKHECEELKKQLETSEKWRIKAESSNEKLDLKNTRYREALEEIEEATKINCEEICGRKFEDCNDFLCPSKNIIDIINKAKEGNNENT